MKTPDKTIRSALAAFSDSLESGWDGRREREAVSLFAFGPLLNQLDQNGFLRHPLQIGLEVPIPQVTLAGEDSDGKKNQVCKDLVIWNIPRMTCWDKEGNPTIAPDVVMEWKFSDDSISERDVKWLQAFTSDYPDCVGYAVTGNRPGSAFTVSCSRVYAGEVKPEWVHIE